MLLAQSGLEPGPVIGLVIQRGGIDLQIHGDNGLVPAWIVRKGQNDISRSLVRDQPSLDPLLRRNLDDQVALDHGLAGESVSLPNVGRGQAQTGPAPDVPVLHEHRAPSAAALAPAGHVEIDASGPRCLVDQRTGGDLDRIPIRIESDSKAGDANPLLPEATVDTVPCEGITHCRVQGAFGRWRGHHGTFGQESHCGLDIGPVRTGADTGPWLPALQASPCLLHHLCDVHVWVLARIADEHHSLPKLGG